MREIVLCIWRTIELILILCLRSIIVSTVVFLILEEILADIDGDMYSEYCSFRLRLELFNTKKA